MYRRPLSVSFVGWILCILGVLGGVSLFWIMKRSPHITAMQVSSIFGAAQIAVVVVNPVMTFVCGVFVLKGANWARWLYPICFAGMAIFLKITNPGAFNIIPTVMAQGALILFLFLPSANEFFSSPGPSPQRGV